MRRVMKLVLIMFIPMLILRAETMYTIPCKDLEFLKNYETVCSVNPTNHMFRQNINYVGEINLTFENGTKEVVESNDGFEIAIREDSVFTYTAGDYSSPKIKLSTLSSGKPSWLYFYAETKRWRLYDISKAIDVTLGDVVILPVDPIVEIVDKAFFSLAKPLLGDKDIKPIDTGWKADQNADFTFDLVITTDGDPVVAILENSGYQDLDTAFARTYIGTHKKKIIFGLGNRAKLSLEDLKPNTTYICKMVYKDGGATFYVNNKVEHTLTKDEIDFTGKKGNIFIGARNGPNGIDRKATRHDIIRATIREGAQLPTDTGNQEFTFDARIVYEDKSKTFSGPIRLIFADKLIEKQADSTGKVVFNLGTEETFILTAFNPLINEWSRYMRLMKINEENVVYEQLDDLSWLLSSHNYPDLENDIINSAEFEGDVGITKVRKLVNKVIGFTPGDASIPNQGFFLVANTTTGKKYKLSFETNYDVKIWLTDKDTKKSVGIHNLVKGGTTGSFTINALGKTKIYFAPKEQEDYLLKNVTLLEQ